MKFLILGMTLSTAGGLRINSGQQTPTFDLKTESATDLEKTVAGLESGVQLLKKWDYERAVLEFGKKYSELSEFAKHAYKFPKSMVDHVNKMKNRTKRTRTYNFVGSMSGTTLHKKGARKWVSDFAKANFKENDIFIASKAHGDAEWQPIGQFDKSKELGARDHHRRVTLSPTTSMDVTYYEMLVSSQFTVCPGGDDPFSHRVYEAALAGSIPLIKSIKEDASPHGGPSYSNLGKVFKLFKYQTIDEPRVYDQSIVDHNYDVVIKYMTFIEGDNVPPKV